MPEPYYDYTTNPVTQNHPNATSHWESTADWPKNFQVVTKFGSQGLHPAAPVYQTNQPTSQTMAYFAGNNTSPAGYYVNGVYYGPSAPAAPAAGWPYTSSSLCYYSPTSTSQLAYYSYSSSYPSTYQPNYLSSYPSNYLSSYSSSYPYNCPYKYSPYSAAPATPFYYPSASQGAAWPYNYSWGASQAAAAVAANAILAQAPSAPYYFVGSSAAEIQAQNAIIAAQMMAAGQPMGPPNQLVPYKPGDSPQFWCKELDGSWTLREIADFAKGDLANGRWEVHPTSGYRYFVKQP